MSYGESVVDLNVVVFDDERAFMRPPDGSVVLYARTPDTFRELVNRIEIDVLLLDHDLGGLETTRQACLWHVEGIQSGLFKVPQQVIVVTGNPAGGNYLMDLYRQVVEYPTDLFRDPFGRASGLRVR